MAWEFDTKIAMWYLDAWSNADLLSTGARTHFNIIQSKLKHFHTRNISYIVICKNMAIPFKPQCVNTLRPRQNGRHFPDDSFKWIFLNKFIPISIEVSLKFVPKGPINNIPSLVQIMAWRRPGDKPLSEPMLVSLLTHICVTRPQWVKSLRPSDAYMHQ